MDEVATEGGIEIAWRPVPTVLAEVPLGHSYLAGLTRIVMGEVAFNEAPGASKPKYQPVFTWAIPDEAIPGVIAYLQHIVDQQNGNR